MEVPRKVPAAGDHLIDNTWTYSQTNNALNDNAQQSFFKAGQTYPAWNFDIYSTPKIGVWGEGPRPRLLSALGTSFMTFRKFAWDGGFIQGLRIDARHDGSTITPQSQVRGFKMDYSSNNTVAITNFLFDDCVAEYFDNGWYLVDKWPATHNGGIDNAQGFPGRIQWVINRCISRLNIGSDGHSVGYYFDGQAAGCKVLESVAYRSGYLNSRDEDAFSGDVYDNKQPYINEGIVGDPTAQANEKSHGIYSQSNGAPILVEDMHIFDSAGNVSQFRAGAVVRRVIGKGFGLAPRFSRGDSVCEDSLFFDQVDISSKTAADRRGYGIEVFSMSGYDESGGPSVSRSFTARRNMLVRRQGTGSLKPAISAFASSELLTIQDNYANRWDSQQSNQPEYGATFFSEGNGAPTDYPGSTAGNVDADNTVADISDDLFPDLSEAEITALVFREREAYDPGTHGTIPKINAFRLVADDPALPQLDEAEPGNTAPTVDAGGDDSIQLPTASIGLTGTASDADGTVDSVLWTQVSKPAGADDATITDEDTLTPTISDLTAGVWVFRLTATDDDADTASDDVTITVFAEPTATGDVTVVQTKKPATVESTNSITLAFDTAPTVGNWVVAMFSCRADLTVTADPSSQLTNTAEVDSGNSTAPELMICFDEVGEGHTNSYNFQTTTGGQIANMMLIELAGVETIAQPDGAETGDTSDQTSLTIPGVTTETANQVIMAIASTRRGGGSGTVTLTADGDHTIIDQTGGENYATLGASLRVVETPGEVTGDAWTANQGARYASIALLITPAAGNALPQVSAGDDQSIDSPASTTTLSGVVSDTDGTIQTKTWSFISGPATPGITSPSSVSTGITGMSAAGDYVFRLTAVDDLGGEAYDEVTVSVVVPNVAPTVQAGADQAIQLPTSEATLTAVGADTDGTVTYQWSFLSKPAGADDPTLTNDDTDECTASDLVSGQYVFQVVVTDDDDATAEDVVIVTVHPAASTGTSTPGFTLQVPHGKSFTIPLFLTTLGGRKVTLDPNIVAGDFVLSKDAEDAVENADVTWLATAQAARLVVTAEQATCKQGLVSWTDPDDLFAAGWFRFVTVGAEGSMLANVNVANQNQEIDLTSLTQSIASLNARLGTAQITNTASLLESGRHLVTVQGDSYESSSPRGVVAWMPELDDDWPDLTGATATFTSRRKADDVIELDSIACEIINPAGPGKAIQLSLSAAQTRMLTAGQKIKTNKFDVRVTLASGKVWTPIRGGEPPFNSGGHTIVQDQTRA